MLRSADMNTPTQSRQALYLRTPRLRGQSEDESTGYGPVDPGAICTKFDFCMLGMVGEDDLGIAPAKKTTGIMTNGKVIAEVISQHRCDGLHRHVHLVHGKAKACEIYPEPFRRTLCQAYTLQIEHDQKTNRSDGDRSIAAILDVSEIMGPLVDRESSCCLAKSTVGDGGETVTDGGTRVRV